MCGIAGIFALESEAFRPEEVRQMCAALRHRGPDESGYYADAHAALGMRRLSIIDLETGRQPIRNEDGTVWAVLNGEIYNYKDLRADLTRRGHTFYTASDTETLVHLYEEHGPRCVERLRGMFAFAIWDKRLERLTLARDRFGIKPLYYAVVGSRLIFASELKAMLQVPSIPRRLHWGALGHLFGFLTTPSSQSIIDGVRKLEPAHLLIASLGHGHHVERYWEVRFAPDDRHDAGWFVDRLRGQLEESVALHMVSDVPVGAFLSGGIDSSSVVSFMSQRARGPVKTFSVGFADHDYDELAYARQVANRFGTEHHEVIVEPDATAILDDLAWHLDEPFGDPSAIPTFMLSKLAAGHVKVVLSGDGGDEVFAGYDKYVVEARERAARLPPRGVRRLLGAIGRALPEGTLGRNRLQHMALDGPARYLDSVTLFRRDEMSRLFRPEVYEMIAPHDGLASEIERLARFTGTWLDGLQWLDLQRYLPLDILTKVDRMSMAHSLEVRVPLLDHRLVEFAATIPPGLRLNGTRTKHIFKEAMRGLLPDVIVDRPKHGFAVPVGRWFRGKLSQYVEETLLAGPGSRRGLFDPAWVRGLIDRHRRGREVDLQLFTLLSFELWCRNFLDARPGKIVPPTPVPELRTRPVPRPAALSGSHAPLRPPHPQG